MNNETTASQPMQELVRDLYNFEGGRHFALRLEKLLASQPKSIGDDALDAAMADKDQVPYLIVFDDNDKPNEIVIGGTRAEYRFKQISGSWNAHLFAKVKSNSRDDKRYHDNFRAPADQASATIQAAPTASSISYWTGPTDSAGTPIDRPDNTSPNGWGEYVPTTLKHGRTILERGDKDKRVKFLYDATIQEPVMVAEPVDKQVKFLRELCKAYGPKSLQYDIEHPCDGLNSADPAEVLRVQRGQVAAPMVADPAGLVSVQELSDLAERALALPKSLSTRSWELTPIQLGWIIGQVCRSSVAATVKAVPSEAPCMVVFNTDSQVKGCDWGKVPPGVYHVFAAPLAYKTGASGEKS